MLEFKKLTLDSKSVFEKYTKFKYEKKDYIVIDTAGLRKKRKNI